MSLCVIILLSSEEENKKRIKHTHRALRLLLFSHSYAFHISGPQISFTKGFRDQIKPINQYKVLEEKIQYIIHMHYQFPI